MTDLSRRTVIRLGTAGLTGTLIAGRVAAAERLPIDVGKVEGSKVTFPPVAASTEAKSSERLAEAIREESRVTPRR